MDSAKPSNGRGQFKRNPMDIETRNCIHKLKCKVARLEMLLELRETEFKSEYERFYQTISSYEDQLATLKLQMESTQHLSHQDNQMASELEEEKKKVSDLTSQIFTLTLENQKSLRLQTEMQQRIKDMEQQLLLRDTHVDNLNNEKQRLAERLTATTELLQKDRVWERKYQALEEKFSQELPEKEDGCEEKAKELEEEKTEPLLTEETRETGVNQVEEEKKDLEELCLKKEMKKKKKEKKGFMSWIRKRIRGVTAT